MAFRNRIKEARKTRGLTQAQLGERIGVAKSTMAGYEKGTSRPDEEKIIKLMNVLKVDANYLWQDDIEGIGNVYAISPGETTPRLQTSDEVSEILADLMTLPPEALNEAKYLIDLLKSKHKEGDQHGG